MARGDSEASGENRPARKFTRGGVLKAGATAAAVVGAGPLASAAQAGGRDPLAYLHLTSYQPLLNAKFTLHHPHGPIDVKLVEALNLTTRGAREQARRECFSLIFETQHGEPLTQGSYELEHSALGRFTLFLVPVGRGKKGVELEAVVNRWLTDKHP